MEGGSDSPEVEFLLKSPDCAAAAGREWGCLSRWEAAWIPCTEGASLRRDPNVHIPTRSQPRGVAQDPHLCLPAAHLSLI